MPFDETNHDDDGGGEGRSYCDPMAVALVAMKAINAIPAWAEEAGVCKSCAVANTVSAVMQVTQQTDPELHRKVVNLLKAGGFLEVEGDDVG